MTYLRIFLAAIFSSLLLQAKPLSVSLSAKSAVLMNAETGMVLYEKGMHDRIFPASITKIGTALYVLEKKGNALEERAEASQNALTIVPYLLRCKSDSPHPSYRLELQGTSMGLRVGEVASLSTLLHGLLLVSGNDAANVLAEAVSGGIDRFMQELNLFFKNHGILETQFTNPHGLHHADHWTTAYDMAQMTRLALKHASFRQIVKTTHYTKPRSQPPKVFVQGNKLLRQGPYFYPKAIGVKTGYTASAGLTIVGAASHEGRELIAVVLNCPKKDDLFRDVRKLFEAAFAQKKMTRTLFAKETDRFTHSIRHASRPLEAALKEDFTLEYYPAEEPSFRAEIEWKSGPLPIALGDVVGQLRCVDTAGNVLLEKPVFATHSLKKHGWASFVDFCFAHRKGIVSWLLGGVVVLCIYCVKKRQKFSQR